MEDVAAVVFPGEQPRSGGEKVSVVTRCYGFEGRNSGIFSKWGIAGALRDSDIKEFVKTYPRGCRFDNGAEMRQFLLNKINERTAQEEANKRRLQAQAEEARRRKLAIEAEERRREAEARRREAELKRQREEEERRLQEYRKLQYDTKMKAVTMAEAAKAMFARGNDYGKIKEAVKLYRQALDISWMETNQSGTSEYKTALPIEDCYLLACEFLARYEYKAGKYDEAWKYCGYVCGSSYFNHVERSIHERLGWMLKSSHERAGWMVSIKEKRTKDIHPEAGCLAIMTRILMKRNDFQNAVSVGDIGAYLGSTECMEIVGDIYSRASDQNACLYSYYYYDLIGLSNERIDRKKSSALLKVLEFRSREVDQSLKKYNNDWLPLSGESSDWKTYFNLSENDYKDLPRRPKAPDEKLSFGTEPMESAFEKMGYRPGAVNLQELWQTYKSLHYAETKRGFLFNRTLYTYKGDLLEGDFADCCKYIFEKRIGANAEEKNVHSESGSINHLNAVVSEASKMETASWTGDDLNDKLTVDSSYEEKVSVEYHKVNYTVEKNKIFACPEKGTQQQFAAINWLSEQDSPVSLVINETGIYVFQNLCEWQVGNGLMHLEGKFRIQRYSFDGNVESYYKLDFPVNNARIQGNILMYCMINDNNWITYEM